MEIAMQERLQKILSARGVASRRKAEEWITAGRITVNGNTAVLGDRADPETDEIRVDGKLLPEEGAPVYLMLNKPRGYVTTLQDEKGRKCAAELVKGCGVRVYPVGRLDMDSEGLLLFTNDGAFAQKMMHPSHETEKAYEVWVRGWKDGSESLLSRQIVLDKRRIAPPIVHFIGEKDGVARVSVTIHEGRNRQVRRMCAAANLQVLRLLRVREGQLSLSRLPSGKWRYLTQEELQKLKNDN